MLEKGGSRCLTDDILSKCDIRLLSPCPGADPAKFGKGNSVAGFPRLIDKHVHLSRGENILGISIA